MSVKIQDFVGTQYLREGTAWEQQAWANYNYQYATSSHGIDHDMHPALIVQPKNEDDIITAVKYAIASGIAVSIKSGGHQYSGACSTSGKNIMIDLKPTFRDQKADLKVLPQAANGKTWVYASVSWSLGEFNGFLAQNGLFVPHGQCIDVRLGGHTQSGGYGQLIRSFGLLGDHVRGIRLIDHEAKVREIDAESDPDLFYSILGGSPGNFGVITHYTYEVHRDEDFVFGDVRPKGLKSIWWYSHDTLQALLTKLAEMADDEDFPRNYDFCVSTLSSEFPVLDLFPEVDGVMKRDHPEIFGIDGLPGWPKTIIVYAQFVPFSADDKYDPKWFDGILDCVSSIHRLHHEDFTDIPMSAMTRQWIFTNIREFDHPYIKRTYCSSSTTLVKDGWPKMVADRLHQVMKPSDTDLYNNCWVSCQISVFGGNKTRFHAPDDDGGKYKTSYSWRDSSVGCTVDLFHESAFEPVADKWQSENDEAFNGKDGKFSKGHEKRVLWGSYGNWDLHDQWRFYYEDQEKYDRLRKARAAADPKGTFTPNPFCVKRWEG